MLTARGLVAHEPPRSTLYSGPKKTSEYSQDFYTGEYRVLRGGCWATDPLVARTTFRNWDYPIRRQIFAGFRTARDA